MKTELLNAVTIDLIDKLDFLPMADNYDALAFPGRIRGFEKRDISEYYILELIDMDLFSEYDAKTLFTKKLQWLKGNEIVDFKGIPYLIEVFVMHNSNQSKVNLIKALHNSAVEQGMCTAYIIMDLDKEDLIFDWGLMDPCLEIEDVLGHWLGSDAAQFETLPDLEDIINRYEPDPVLQQVSKATPLSYTLIAINIIIWIIGAFSYLLYKENLLNTWGIKNNALIFAGQYWRIITPIFLHADIMHLATNCLSLLLFGSTVERAFGSRKFLLIYFFSGLTGNIMSIVLTPYNSLGASGAILGIGGALIYLWRKNRYFFSLNRNQYLVLVYMVFFNIFYGLISPGIDNNAHIGGFVGGFLVTALLEARRDSS